MTRLYLTTIKHVRSSPIRHRFTHESCSWLVDLDRVDEHGRPDDLPRWLTTLLRFRSRDHLGDARMAWRDNVVAFAADNGVDLEGGSIRALTSGRLLGHVFNPLTIYWCRKPGGAPACVIAEVHNTYGERHAYLLHPDDRGRAATDKQLYVSPFNDVDGWYRLSVPEPDERLQVTVTLHRPDQEPFVTSWTGYPVTTRRDQLAAAARLPLSTWLVSLRIRSQGIRLWRRLPAVPRPTHQPQELG